MITSVGVFGIVLFKMGMFGLAVVFYITTHHYAHCLIANQTHMSTLRQNEHVFLSSGTLIHTLPSVNLHQVALNKPFNGFNPSCYIQQ